MTDAKKDPLYHSAKMRCRALIAYGRSDEFIINELRNSFWPDPVSDQVIEELHAMRNQKITFKSNVQLSGFK